MDPEAIDERLIEREKDNRLRSSSGVVTCLLLGLLPVVRVVTLTEELLVEKPEEL